MDRTETENFNLGCCALQGEEDGLDVADKIEAGFLATFVKEIIERGFDLVWDEAWEKVYVGIDSYGLELWKASNNFCQVFEVASCSDQFTLSLEIIFIPRIVFSQVFRGVLKLSPVLQDHVVCVLFGKVVRIHFVHDRSASIHERSDACWILLCDPSDILQIVGVQIKGNVSKKDVSANIVESLACEAKLTEFFGLKVGKNSVQDFRWK